MSPLLLEPSFFARPTLEVARDLLGVTLEHDGCCARIVETEAYTDDPASHYVTRRHTGAMLGTTHGLVYLYTIYGMHRCLNFTTDASAPGAVLIRAVEPLSGLDAMRARRPVRRDRDLTNGPAKLVEALGIGPELHRLPAVEAFALRAPEQAPPVENGPRIGISRARELPWRFCIPGNPFVSR